MDLEKFFDRVNHDVRVAREIRDKRVPGLIRRYLKSGMMVGGLEQPRTEGTPRGGPLSPLLSNILLSDLDRELQRRGHAFCRYADDCKIYVRSRRAGRRVMASVTGFLERRLKLRVNAEKSAVDRPWNRKFLGYSMTWNCVARLKVAAATARRLKDALRQQFRRGRGRNLKRFIREDLNPKLRGWMQYFRLSEVKCLFEELGIWIRHHLRAILWRQWKRPRTRYQRLLSLGLPEEQSRRSAFNGRGPWYNSGAQHMRRAIQNRTFALLGLVALLTEHRRLQPRA